MIELDEATPYTRKAAKELTKKYKENQLSLVELLARALATPVLIEPEDPDDLLADAWMRKHRPSLWAAYGRKVNWGHVRDGIRIARENPL